MRFGLFLLAALIVAAPAAAERLYAGLSYEQARVQAVQRLDRFDPNTSLLVLRAVPGIDPFSGRKAWQVLFHSRSGSGFTYSGCTVYDWRGGGRVGAHCRGWRR
jgi:hypothetical protein